MTFSATDIQAFVIASVGDTPTNTLTTNAALYWSFYADKGQMYPRLQQAYFTRACCDVVLGSLRSVVNITESGTSISDAARFDHVKALRDQAEGEIRTLEGLARRRRPMSIGRIAQPAPVSVADVANQAIPAPGYLDANDAGLSGNPYYPTWNGGAR